MQEIPDESVNLVVTSSPFALNRKIRDARFRANVLLAYSYRCCMCGVQLSSSHFGSGRQFKGTGGRG